MNYRALIAILALLSPMAAHAWTCASAADPDGWINTQPGQECYMTPQQIAALYGTGSNQAQSQTQGQHQGQAQTAGGGAGGTANATGGSATGGSATQSQDASNQGNSQTENDYSSVSYPRQTPPAVAGFVQPTASCKNARNAGASVPVAGISFGVSTTDKQCDLRETARMAYEMGQVQIAVRLLCASDAAKRALGGDCHYVAPPPLIVSAAPLISPPVTQEQLREVEQRMTRKLVTK